MSEIAGVIGRVLGSFVRALHWSLSTVEDAPETRVAPMPGPAHGPVSAIDVRRGRRRSSS